MAAPPFAAGGAPAPLPPWLLSSTLAADVSMASEVSSGASGSVEGRDR
jgi:hypothetical protein